MRKQRAIPKSIVVFWMFLSLLVQPASAVGYSINYKNCAQLKAKYRFGVALSLKIAGDYPAKVSKSIYMSHIFLDFDLDGIVCEIELLQKNLNPNTQTTVTTATTPTTTSIPLPQSPQNLNFRNGATASLRTGVTYIINVCGKIQYPTYLEVLSISTGWTTKAVATWQIDAIFCGTEYPYRVSFGWVVTEKPGEVSNMRTRGFSVNWNMTVVITN